jgi:hypothetical protein
MRGLVAIGIIPSRVFWMNSLCFFCRMLIAPFLVSGYAGAFPVCFILLIPIAIFLLSSVLYNRALHVLSLHRAQIIYLHSTSYITPIIYHLPPQTPVCHRLEKVFRLELPNAMQSRTNLATVSYGSRIAHSSLYTSSIVDASRTESPRSFFTDLYIMPAREDWKANLAHGRLRNQWMLKWGFLYWEGGVVDLVDARFVSRNTYLICL